MLGSELASPNIPVLATLHVRGFTLISSLRVSLQTNLAILAKRAKTNGSVVLSTVSTILKKGIGTQLIQSNDSGTILRTHFTLAPKLGS